MSQGLCGACRTEQVINPSGTIRKHNTADGETCVGSGQKPAEVGELVQIEELAAEPVQVEAEDQWPEDNAGDGAESDEPAGDDDTEPDEPTADNTPPAAAEPTPPVRLIPEPDPGIYPWTMTIKHPAIYLGDAEWHQENALLATIKAQEAGHTVTGEARWDGGIGGGLDEGTVQLTYLVPIEA